MRRPVGYFLNSSTVPFVLFVTFVRARARVYADIRVLARARNRVRVLVLYRVLCPCL